MPKITSNDIALSPEAESHIDGLLKHYESLNRPAASRNLLAAIEAARQRITTAPSTGLRAPRPYPKLTKPGRLWIKEGHYWFSYSLRNRPTISGIFYDTADIPAWLKE